MSKRKTNMTLIAATLSLLSIGGSAATVAKLAPGSKVWLEGKSTLHPFMSETKEFGVDFKAEPAAGAPAALDAAIQAQAPVAMTVKIPVASLKSEHGGLDKNLRKALLADKNPDIVFVMKGYKLEKQKDTGATSVVAWGDLSVAGQTKAETLNGALSSKDGRTVIDGQQPLLMTDFGVKPPSMMLGAVKTEDRVVVKFHLELEPAADEHKGEGK